MVSGSVWIWKLKNRGPETAWDDWGLLKAIFEPFSCAIFGIFYIMKMAARPKDQIILATGRGILADFWVPHEIESCNFQNLLVFRFPETSQNLISFRQLLFSLFQNLKTLEICQNDPYLGPRWSGPLIPK